MKIRGNTVGTTLKPKAALIKSEKLTEEEKAIAREKIGAVGEEHFNTTIGDIETALDELHAYAQGLISGGEPA